MQERYRGGLLGLAAGDALGTTLEFRRPGSFQPIDDMIGGGPFGLEPGQWTDDTSMALCLAESLVERQGFDPVDQLERYCRWREEGYLSSNGLCFDIGGTVSAALSTFRRTGKAWAGSTDPRAAGNGSLMRLVPVPLAFARDPEQAILMSGDSSRTTHGARECIDACRYFGGLIVGALRGATKEQLLSDHHTPVPGFWDGHPLSPKIDAVASGSFKEKAPPAIRGTGYVVDCLEAALWAFHSSDSFEHGALAAANLGNDADTTGAVYGQLAGVYYGESGIPAGWRDKTALRDVITDLADRLLTFAGSQT
jgi:ADP-ribosylglycohydrolase